MWGASVREVRQQRQPGDFGNQEALTRGEVREKARTQNIHKELKGRSAHSHKVTGDTPKGSLLMETLRIVHLKRILKFKCTRRKR